MCEILCCVKLATAVRLHCIQKKLLCQLGVIVMGGYIVYTERSTRCATVYGILMLQLLNVYAVRHRKSSAAKPAVITHAQDPSRYVE